MKILRLQCDDKPGIVAAVATALSNNQCNIEESSQYNDPFSNQFFMRVVFTTINSNSLENFKKSFAPLSQTFDMNWRICDADEKVKTVLLVSQYDHCLNDLLYRSRSGHLPIEITAVISNHETAKNMVMDYDLPFYHLPITKETKTEQERIVGNIIDETNSELIVMARYMQILTENFCDVYQGRVINIHHSFLPGFKGARPYHQAYERGVKIIGATAHFATADLDEGPIIAQDIEHIDHGFTPKTMEQLGQDTESRVLARAIDLYAQRRIFLKDRRTIIL